jgi:3-(3-hydroxy-phenyl)propionate hydroxylase
MPDLHLVTDAGPLCVFTLLHDARPVLIHFGGGFDIIAPSAERARQIDARYDGAWELPVLGAVAPPTAARGSATGCASVRTQLLADQAVQ